MHNHNLRNTKSILNKQTHFDKISSKNSNIAQGIGFLIFTKKSIFNTKLPSHPNRSSSDQDSKYFLISTNTIYK